MQDLFADIRPHYDDDVAAVLARLLSSADLRRALLTYRYPNRSDLFYRFMSPWAGLALRYRLSRIHTVDEFQRWLTTWIEQVLHKTTSVIEVRGLENLTPQQAYLWISNHRDIAMDPTMINYSLYQAGWATSRIAIGDNLLKHPDVADIMRLNKSFLVKRGISNKREKLRELQRLSQYIRHSLDDHHSIWIAQREGRAKDGIDGTDTAVLKMLALHGRDRGESFIECMMQMRPVPVSIQYEWDPCDVLKARELVAREELGHYQKAEGEDTRSIILGLTGFKGRVLVDFGQPLTEQELSSADSMAAAIDAQIRDRREVLPVHQTALALLQTQGLFTEVSGGVWHNECAVELRRRCQGETLAVQQRLLMSYAAGLLPQESKLNRYQPAEQSPA